MRYCYVNYFASDDKQSPDLFWLSSKTYFEQNSNIKCDWIYPFRVRDNKTVDQLSREILSKNPTIVGFSLYVWNTSLSLEVAEHIKALRPDVFIMVGGPNVTYESDLNYFKKNWFIDVAHRVDGYGEVFILDVLSQIYDKKLNLNEVSYAIYPSTNRTFFHRSTKNPNKLQFEWPDGIFEKNLPYLNSLGNISDIIYEGSRGCPYSCVFCEWGGGTQSKVTFKPTHLITNDLKFIFDNFDPKILQFTDANFGIIQRDVSVIDYLTKHKNKGLRFVEFYGPTKTNKKYLNEIYDLLLKNNILNKVFKISVQDFNEDVLKNIKRTDVSWETQVQDIKHIIEKYDSNVTITYELMLGLPGITLDLFYESFDKIQNNSAMRHIWYILPTSPASHKDYINQFKIKTVKTSQIMTTDSAIVTEKDVRYSDNKNKIDVVVETYSYTRRDWITMLLVDRMYSAYKSSGILSLQIKYICKHTNIKMSNFIRDFYTDFLLGNKLHDIQNNILEKTLNEMILKVQSESTTAIDFVPLGNTFPGEILAHLSSIFIIVVMIDPNKFFDELLNWCKSYYNDEGLLDSILWTKQSLITMDYNSTTNKYVESSYNWFEFLSEDDDLKKQHSKWIVNSNLDLQFHKYNVYDRFRKFFLNHCSSIEHNKLYSEYKLIS